MLHYTAIFIIFQETSYSKLQNMLKTVAFYDTLIIAIYNQKGLNLMNNENNLCGCEIMGYMLTSLQREDCFGKSYIAKSLTTADETKAVIYHISLPTDAQYADILASKGGDVKSADEYVTENINMLLATLHKLKEISSSDKYSLAPVYDYTIEKSQSAPCYDVFVRTKQMIPVARFAKANGLTVRDGMQLGMQMLGAMDIAHQAGICHGNIDIDNVFIDETGRCKIFGAALQRAAAIPAFDMAAASVCAQREDTVGIACVLYKLFNDFSFPADSTLPDMPNYRSGLYSGSEFGNIIAPAKSNGALADTLLKAFAGPVGSYANCEQLAAALGTAMQSFDASVLDASITEAASQPTPAPQKAAPEPAVSAQQHHYDNTNSYFKPSPVVPVAEVKKSSKPMIITLISVSAVLIISIIAFLLWQFVFSGDDASVPVTDNTPIVEIDGSSLTLFEDETSELVYTAKNISEEELDFISSDESVVTVDFDGIITAVAAGKATVSITDSNGEKLDSIKVTVEANPDVDKIDTAYIESLLASGPSGSKYGVYVIDVAEGKEYEFSNSRDVLGSSALVSMPLLYTYGQWIDSGDISPDTNITLEYTYERGRGIFKENDGGKQYPISRIVSAMLTHSDNNCINTLMNYFSKEEIASTMRTNGMNGTNVLRNLANNPPDNVENQISAYDAGQMLYQMITDEVSPGKDFITSYFRISDNYGRNGIGNAIPSDALFLNHNASTSSKYNEIAYVESGDAKFILVFISNGGKPDVNSQLASDIAGYVYQSFTSQ